MVKFLEEPDPRNVDLWLKWKKKKYDQARFIKRKANSFEYNYMKTRARVWKIKNITKNSKI